MGDEMKFLILWLCMISSALAQSENLQWNRYETQNFVILSLDNEQGNWLNSNLESLKSDCLNRWGFPDDKFTKECRIFCVPNKDLLKKLFKIDEPKVEIKKDISVVWTISQDSKSISKSLMMVCLSELEEKQKIQIGFWFKKGASELNGQVHEIQNEISALHKFISRDDLMFTSKKMFEITENEYLKLNEKEKKLFDIQATTLCLMLRKEFGEAHLQGFLRFSGKNNPENVLKVIYNFQSYSHFDKQYIRYMKDLSSDIIKEKTPIAYLKVQSVN